MGAAEEDLRALGFSRDLVEIRADTVAGVEVLARDAVIAADDAFGLAEIDDDVAVFDALNRAVDDLADAILEVIVLAVTFGFADLARDDLLGGLGGDAAEFEGGQLFPEFVADFGVRIHFLGVFQVQLRDGVLDGFDDGLDAPEAGLARVRIDLGADVMFEAVARAGGFLDRLLHRLKHDALVDVLLSRDRVGDLQDFQLVR